MGSLISILITLLFMGLLFWAVNWFIGYIGIGEPFITFARAILGLIALIYLLGLFFGYSPQPAFLNFGGGHSGPLIR